MSHMKPSGMKTCKRTCDEQCDQSRQTFVISCEIENMVSRTSPIFTNPPMIRIISALFWKQLVIRSIPVGETLKKQFDKLLCWCCMDIITELIWAFAVCILCFAFLIPIRALQRILQTSGWKVSTQKALKEYLASFSFDLHFQFNLFSVKVCIIRMLCCDKLATWRSRPRISRCILSFHSFI